MQGMKNRTECTLSRENETLPGAKPVSYTHLTLPTNSLV